MDTLNFKKTYIKDLFIVESKQFEDKRGYFMESYNGKEFSKMGLEQQFVQENESFSTKGVLRGLHFQNKHPQGKLVRVLQGKVYDVAVDLRKNSSTYGKYYGIILSADNKKQMYIPEQFAHGFLVLSDYAHFMYKCTDYYYKEYEGGIIWNDPRLGIKWPLEQVEKLILSEKDKNWYKLQDIETSI